MRITTQIKVLGMKASKGMLENGSKYDSTKVYAETELDDSKGNAKGFSVAEYNFGFSEEFEKFKHLPFPFLAEAVMEIVSTGKAQRTQMTGLKPIETANKKVA